MTTSRKAIPASPTATTEETYRWAQHHIRHHDGFRPYVDEMKNV